MKKLIILILLSLVYFANYAQNTPITFEAGENGANWTWTTFENDDNPDLEIVDNPSKTGVNTSDKVAKFTSRSTGAPWAGCESLHGSDIGNYKIDASNSTITIMVYKTVISDVGIKLVTASGWSKGELKVANTKINEWEKLTFDFSTVNHENMTYDQIVIFPDFKDRSEDHISYFDNIKIGDKEINSTTEIANSDIKIYPNPTVDFVKIYNPKGLKIESCTVMNYQGQILKSITNPIRTINLVDLSAGLYTVRFRTSEGIVTQKVILK
ncbi:MAG: T9SS type A sorting domain-containing protein [Bacteroidia bacterium]